jgi:HTH-type transcriptional regulator/antitoxin MqsA
MTTKNSHICPVCNSGDLQLDVKSVKYHVGSMPFDVQQLFHWCEICGTEMALPEDARENARAYRSAELKAMGKLNGDDIRALRKSLTLTQEDAGKLLGGGPVAFCKYERNDLTPVDSMDNLLWLIKKFPELIYHLAERHDFQLKASHTWTAPSWDRLMSNFSNPKMEAAPEKIEEPDLKWEMHTAFEGIEVDLYESGQTIDHFNPLSQDRWEVAKVPYVHSVRGTSVQTSSDNDDMYAMARKLPWLTKSLVAHS